MERVQMRALRQLCGEHEPTRVHEGQMFTCSDSDAKSLEARGLAERYRPSVIQRGDDLFAKMIARLQNKRFEVPEQPALGVENKTAPDPSIIPEPETPRPARKRGWPRGRPRKPRLIA